MARCGNGGRPGRRTRGAGGARRSAARGGRAPRALGQRPRRPLAGGQTAEADPPDLLRRRRAPAGDGDAVRRGQRSSKAGQPDQGGRGVRHRGRLALRLQPAVVRRLRGGRLRRSSRHRRPQLRRGPRPVLTRHPGSRRRQHHGDAVAVHHRGARPQPARRHPPSRPATGDPRRGGRARRRGVRGARRPQPQAAAAGRWDGVAGSAPLARASGGGSSGARRPTGPACAGATPARAGGRSARRRRVPSPPGRAGRCRPRCAGVRPGPRR